MTLIEPSQYNPISNAYSQITELDPIKRFSQYPSVLAELGGAKTALDIGCGSGTFTRIMAHQKMRVTGFDPSSELVAIAKAHEQQDQLGISYRVASAADFTSPEQFDGVVAVLVLVHASSQSELEDFFRSAHAHLKDGGNFVGLVYNQNFTRWDENYYRRKWQKLNQTDIQVSFLDERDQVISQVSSHYITEMEYQSAARTAGFGEITWKALTVSEAGLQELGRDYWKGWQSDCPYKLLICQK